MKTLLILVIGFSLNSCSSTTSPTRMNSSDYDDQQERVKALKFEIMESSDFIDAEFDLLNVNGFKNSRASLPGASSLDYKIAVKVDTSLLDKWIEGMVPIELENYNFDWTQEITGARKANWAVSGTPETYVREGDDVALIVYRRQGILFKRMVIE